MGNRKRAINVGAHWCAQGEGLLNRRRKYLKNIDRNVFLGYSLIQVGYNM